jgi:hypothetical protein
MKLLKLFVVLATVYNSENGKIDYSPLIKTCPIKNPFQSYKGYSIELRISATDSLVFSGKIMTLLFVLYI